MVFGYSTTVVHGTWKKISRRPTITKKYIFSTLSTVLCMGFKKKFSQRSPFTEKKYIFVSDYSTTMVHGTWEKIQLTLDREKKYIFSGYSTSMMHGI